MMRRRELIAGIGSAAAWPVMGRADSSRCMWLGISALA